MRINRIIVTALARCVATLPAARRTRRLLVDVEWLSQHLNDRGLVVLHVGNKAEYDAGHIPGARFVTEEDVAAPHDHSNPKDMMLELPPARHAAREGRLARHLGRQPRRRLLRQERRRPVGDTHHLHAGLPWPRPAHVAAGRRAGGVAARGQERHAPSSPHRRAGKLSARPPKGVGRGRRVREGRSCSGPTTCSWTLAPPCSTPASSQR